MTTRALPRANAEIGDALDQHGRVFARRAALLVWLALLALSAVVYFAGVPARHLFLLQQGYRAVGALQSLGLTVDFIPLYVGTFDTLAALTYLVVGILIFWRQPYEWVAYFSSVLLITTTVALGRPPESLPLVDSAFHLPLSFLFALGLSCGVVFIFIFPDGRFQPRWTFIPAVAGAGYVTLVYLSPVLQGRALPWPPPQMPVGSVLVMALGFLVQVYRYRHVSSSLQKQQTKWVIYGIALSIVALVMMVILIPVFAPQLTQPGGTVLAFNLVVIPLFYIGIACTPLGLALSILRFRLWDIDLLINRTLVYIPLTAILAGLSAATISVLQKLFLTLTGQQSDLATVIATLVVVAAFTPVKERLQKVVDRRYKPPRDPAERLTALAEEVRTRLNAIDPYHSTRRLLEVAVSAFGAQGGAVYWRGTDDSVPEHTLGDWRATPELRMPIQAGSRTLGIITLGKRLYGAEYSRQDFQSLEELSTLIAGAIEQDRQNDTPRR